MRLAVIKPVAMVLLKELWLTFTLLIGVSFVAFMIIQSAPGDPFSQLLGGVDQGAEGSESVYETLGIAKTWYGQYFTWLSHVLMGDLGTSIRSGQPVSFEVLGAGINTLYLTVSALIVTLLIAMPIAIYTSLHDTKPQSIVFNIIAYMLSAVPVFWLGYLAIYISTNVFGFFPLGLGSSDAGNIAKFLIPIIVLGLGSGMISEVIRHLRLEITRVLNEEYIRTAKAKGASIWQHAFKEGMLIPTTEIMAIKMPFIIGGAVIIEQVFNWPGMGRMAWQAAQDRDYPVILGITLAAAILVRMSNFFHKLIFVSVNPRASHI